MIYYTKFKKNVDFTQNLSFHIYLQSIFTPYRLLGVRTILQKIRKGEKKKMKNLAKVTLATVIGFCGIGAFSQTDNVKAAGLDGTSQDYSLNVNTSTVTNKQSIIPEQKTIEHHHVKYEKRKYQSAESLPKEIYYSSEGFKGFISAVTTIDTGDYFIACYSGTVIRC